MNASLIERSSIEANLILTYLQADSEIKRH